MNEAEVLRSRLQQLELQQAQLKREKEMAESEFGQQRSKFRDILVKRESKQRSWKFYFANVSSFFSVCLHGSFSTGAFSGAKVKVQGPLCTCE